MTKNQELENVKRQNDNLRKALEEERQRIEGYKEVAKIHTAYISILLLRLGADDENTVAISSKEVKCVIANYETRAYVTESGVRLYFRAKE